MGKPDIEEIGRRIRAARLAKGLMLGELADLVGISKGYMSQLETGTPGANPTLEVLKRIADELDVTIADLLGAPKTQARLEMPEDLPAGLLELVAEYRKAGKPLDRSVVVWLANAKYRSSGPKKKEDYRLLLHVLRGSGDD